MSGPAPGGGGGAGGGGGGDASAAGAIAPAGGGLAGGGISCAMAASEVKLSTAAPAIHMLLIGIFLSSTRPVRPARTGEEADGR